MSTIIGNPIMLGGGSGISAPIIGKDFNWTGGDGTYQVLDDGGGNWRIKFLTSGVFTPLKAMTIDAFLVGGGAAGKGVSWIAYGGSGGFTATVKEIQLTKNTEYNVLIGAGGSGNGGAGGASTGFTGRAEGANATPGPGGSGGALMKYSGPETKSAGSDGANGGSTYSTGQGSTTREFGESTGDLYAGGGGAAYLSGGTSGIVYAAAGAGGGGGISGRTALPGEPNTGGGGCGNAGGDTKQGAGGSGIVIIRKHKEAAA